MTPTFQGEVQMRRWSDSSTQGVQVTFALPDTESLEPLKHKAGKRFMAVLVEIGDDETPVQPAPRKDTRGPLCREACDYCADPQFHKWVRSVGRPCADETEAKGVILDLCDVSSRKELDMNKDAGDYFIEIVRRPFLHWQREQRSA